VAHRCTDAVGAGVAAADDDNILAFGGDETAVLVLVQNCLGVRREEVHCKVDAFQLTPNDWKVTRLGGTRAEYHRVEFLEQILDGKVFADLGVADELYALLLKDSEAAHDDLFLIELHVGDAIHEQSAGAIGTFKHSDPMTSLVELRGGAKTGGTGTDDGDFFAGALGRRIGGDPAFVPTFVSDRTLDVLDRDWRIGDAKHARTFAGRGADTTCEFGEVVRLVQAIERLAPESAIDEVVPFRNEVVDRATTRHAADQRARVAKWNAAVHTACALGTEFVLRHVQVEFVPVADAIARRYFRG